MTAVQDIPNQKAMEQSPPLQCCVSTLTSLSHPYRRLEAVSQPTSCQRRASASQGELRFGPVAESPNGRGREQEEVTPSARFQTRAVAVRCAGGFGQAAWSRSRNNQARRLPNQSSPCQKLVPSFPAAQSCVAKMVVLAGGSRKLRAKSRAFPSRRWGLPTPSDQNYVLAVATRSVRDRMQTAAGQGTLHRRRTPVSLGRLGCELAAEILDDRNQKPTAVVRRLQCQRLEGQGQVLHETAAARRALSVKSLLLARTLLSNPDPMQAERTPARRKIEAAG